MWLKMIYMIMLRLAFRIWMCDSREVKEVESTFANSTHDAINATYTTRTESWLRADPSMSCGVGSERDGLVVVSVLVFLLFWPGLVALCVRIVAKGREDGGKLFEDEEFLIRFGTVFASYWQSPDGSPLEFENRLWFPKAVVFKGVLLQLLSQALEYHPVAMAGCAIVIHAVYLAALVVIQPYVDLTDVRHKTMTTLDKLCISLEVVQIVTAVLGLVSTEESVGVTATLLVLWILCLVGAALPMVIDRLQNHSIKVQQQNAAARV